MVDAIIAAARRIFEEFLGRPMDWQRVTVGGDPDEILASADWAMAMRYAEAALRAAVPEVEPVTVKPLEWQRSPNWGPGEFVTEWWTESVAGTYRIWCDPTVDPSIWHLEYPGMPFGGTEHSGIEAAKAAAQADYEQRIRSALVPAPHSDMERELAEARAVANAEEETERKLATVVAPDNGTVEEVLQAILECAHAWVAEARIIGNVRAGDIVRAIDAALSGASIPAPAGKAEARREALEEAAKVAEGKYDLRHSHHAHFAARNIATAIRALISNPAREGE